MQTTANYKNQFSEQLGRGSGLNEGNKTSCMFLISRWQAEMSQGALSAVSF